MSNVFRRILREIQPLRRSNSSFPPPIRNPKIPPSKLFIDNQFVDAISGKTFPAISPVTEEVIAEIPMAGKEDVDLATAAAKEAFRLNSPWRCMDASKRGALLVKLASLMERDIALLSSLETLECGKLYSHSVKADLVTSIKNFRYFGGIADKYCGEIHMPDGNYMAYSRREPVGVAGCILCWNYSYLVMAIKMAPALAAGCTLVIKPSRYSSLTSLHFARLVQEAGFPPGVINIVTGTADIGSAIVEHPDIDAISFTGSTPVGQIVHQKAGNTMKRLILQLGGKSANIILKDADIDKAVEHALSGAFTNMGQCCCAASRVFVHESIYDQFQEKVKIAVSKKVIGDPFDLAVDHGPQTTKKQLDIIMKYIEQGKKEGATLLAGGHKLDRPGYFVEPTVFSDVTDDMAIAKEEIFGPVMDLLKYKTLDEVIDRTNKSEFGLVTSVFGKNIDDINTVIQSVRTGAVWVNCYFLITPYAPFGGYKMSGFGREGARYALESFSEIKSVHIKIPSKHS